MRVFVKMLSVCLVLIVLAGFTQSEGHAAAVPIIELNMPTYDFGEVFEGEVVRHHFRVFNRGAAALEIKNVKPG
jgi:hypothetical protein